AVFILQDVRVGAMQNAGACSGEALMRGEPHRMLAELAAASSGFDADQLYIRVAEKRVKQSDGIGAAADASEEMRRQTLLRRENLIASFAADDQMKVADHRGIRMGAEHR